MISSCLLTLIDLRYLASNRHKAESSQDSEDDGNMDYDYSDTDEEISNLKRKHSDITQSNSQIDPVKDKKFKLSKEVN